MNAEITGENEDSIGLHVTDNNGFKHKIEMKKNGGEIYHHYQDNYSDDPDDRTVTENEHVAQAQRFAKFYVYRQRGSDTLSPLPNPDRIGAVAAFVDALSAETFETYFGDYYQQLLSDQGQAESVIDVPEAARTNPLYYRTDVYLDLSPEALHSLSTDSDRSAFEALRTAADTASGGQPALSGVIQELTTHQVGIDADSQQLADQYTEAVSGVHLMWSPANNRTETVAPDLPEIDRKPDARFELPPYEPDSIAEFRDTLVYHLRCQMRDCYLTMGVAPPEDLRIQGPGWFDRSTWFQHYDVYEPYHRTDIDITDWQLEDTPEELLTA